MGKYHDYIYYEDEWNYRTGEIQQGGTFSTGSSSHDSKRSWR